MANVPIIQKRTSHVSQKIIADSKRSNEMGFEEFNKNRCMFRKQTFFAKKSIAIYILHTFYHLYFCTIVTPNWFFSEKYRLKFRKKSIEILKNFLLSSEMNPLNLAEMKNKWMQYQKSWMTDSFHFFSCITSFMQS